MKKGTKKLNRSQNQDISRDELIFNRGISDFKSTFGSDPDSVIDSMNKNNDDIPNQIPIHKIEIQEAGVVRENIPLRVIDPLFGKKTLCLISKLDIKTRISGQRRGLHMSRIGDIIATTSQENFECIEDFIRKVAMGVCESQESVDVKIKLTAPLPFYEDVDYNKKGTKKSLESINLIYEVTLKNGVSIFESGFEFNNITACPCVQQTFKHTLLESGLEKMEIESLQPLLTHSQRCKTKILIKNYLGPLDVLEILKTADKSSVRVQNTLPRVQELHMVYRAHKNPQFMEDVVRNIASNIYSRFRKKYPKAFITVETDSAESIHDFNIQAKIESSFEDLGKLFK